MPLYCQNKKEKEKEIKRKIKRKEILNQEK